VTVKPKKILIVGAGIGGLTTALACLHHGFEVQVLEQAPALENIGAGIQIPPNASKILAALGLEQEIAAHAFRPQALQTRMGQSGRQVFSIALDAQTLNHWGAAYYHIHRADYVAVLSTALQARANNALLLNAAFSHYQQTADGVVAHMADGRQIHGDILIGADGLRSSVRQQILGPEQPRFTGNMAWRAVVPLAALECPPPTSACVWMGPGRHAVTYHLGDGLVNFIGVVERQDFLQEDWHTTGARQQAAADFADWHPMITGLIDKAEALHCWGLYDRQTLSTWVDGRVGLLGDAAHPMLPFMAQGAAMAVEDGWALARCLASYASDTPRAAPNIADALGDYQRHRLPRTQAAQNASRRNAKTFHRSTVVSQLANYGPMWLGGKWAPNLVRQRLDWLYCHDETAVTVG